MDIRNISDCSKGVVAVGALVTLGVTALALAVILKPPFLSRLISFKAAIITGSVAGGTSIALFVLFGCSVRRQDGVGGAGAKNDLGEQITRRQQAPLEAPKPPQTQNAADEARQQRLARAQAHAERLERLHQQDPPAVAAALPQVTFDEERVWPGCERMVASFDNFDELIAIHQNFSNELNRRWAELGKLSPQYAGNPNTLKAQTHAFQVALDKLVIEMFAKARAEEERTLICDFQRREIDRYNKALQTIITTNNLEKRGLKLLQPLAVPQLDFENEFLNTFTEFLGRIAIAPVVPLPIPEHVSEEMKARIAAVKTQPDLLAELVRYYDAFPHRNPLLNALFTAFKSIESLFVEETATETLCSLAECLPALEDWQEGPLKKVFINCLTTLFERAATERLPTNHDDIKVQVADVQIFEKFGICFSNLFDLCQAWDIYSASDATIEAKAAAVEKIALLTPEASPTGERHLYRHIIDRKVEEFTAFLASGDHQIVRAFFFWRNGGRECADRINRANAELSRKLGLNFPKIIEQIDGEFVDLDALAAEDRRRRAQEHAATLALIQQLQNQ